MAAALKIISWNINRRVQAWRQLLASDADVALLQEAGEPPADVAAQVEVDPGPWRTAGAGQERPWRAAVVNISRRFRVVWLHALPIEAARPRDLAVCRPGTLAAAVAKTPSGELTLASLYGAWERPLRSTRSRWIYADGSVHRLISDLSAVIGTEEGHRVIAAGDLNILHGYGEEGSAYWAARYATVFDRMKAIGMPFVGPRHPAGRRADPWPAELPEFSLNVPTYHTGKMTPAEAQRQMDFVFASKALSERVRVRAMNGPDEWGPSDHCRIEIEVA